MNDARYDSDWPGGLSATASLCKPAAHTAHTNLNAFSHCCQKQFPSFKQFPSLKAASRLVRCPSVIVIHTTLVLYYCKSQRKLLASAVPQTLNRTQIEELPLQTGGVGDLFAMFLFTCLCLQGPLGAPSDLIRLEPWLSRRHSKSVACKWVLPRSRWGGWTAQWMYVELAKRKKGKKKSWGKIANTCFRIVQLLFFFHRQAVKNFVFRFAASGKFLWSFLKLSCFVLHQRRCGAASSHYCHTGQTVETPWDSL